MTWNYGDYAFLCSNIPSLTVCNLFVKQFLDHQVPESQLFTPYTRISAGVGIASSCEIPSLHAQGHVGNVANIVFCGLSFFVALYACRAAWQRVAAVGRGEMAAFFLVYALTCIFQLLDSGAFLNQGSIALSWITGIHIGLVVLLFWMLLHNAVLSLQVIEDGTKASCLLLICPAIILFVGSIYIALDVAFTVSGYFQTNVSNIHSAWLFSLTTIFPAVAILLLYVISIYVVLYVLKERRPFYYFTATLFVFALSQGARYALSHTVCTGTGGKIDGSWLATLLETGTMALLYLSWLSITEEYFDETASSSFGLTA